MFFFNIVYFSNLELMIFSVFLFFYFLFIYLFLMFSEQLKVELCLFISRSVLYIVQDTHPSLSLD